jgi:hypothetical protein
MSQKLDSVQIHRLIQLCNDRVSEMEFELPISTSHEITLSANQIVPAIQEMVSRIGKPGLHVRGEGTQPVKTIFEANMEFKPDASIGYHNDLHIAFEVKIIRPSDPSGSFTKAIGQAMTYVSLGTYDASFVLLFDTREKSPLRQSRVKDSFDNLHKNLFVYIW